MSVARHGFFNGIPDGHCVVFWVVVLGIVGVAIAFDGFEVEVEVI